ncbi:Photosynthetic apparatus regulatory protein RegA [Anaerolineae bacterium]|nr:Photosynthetic apparatus regulatory protein RegA [Anaerolineae bacterium]
MDDLIQVLLVDDEESFWMPMRERLMDKGFQVDVATSGPEALAKAKERQNGYQVALIDQVMGPPNGTEIMRELRRLYPGLEVIILTGWGDMTEGEAAMTMGAYRYMSKPISNVDEVALNIRTAARLGQERQQKIGLQALIQAGEQISAAQTEIEIYQRLYEEVKRVLPSLDGFLISRHDEYNKVVTFPFCYIRGKPVSKQSRKIDKGIAEFALARKEPLLLPEGDKPFRQSNNLHPPDPEIGYCSSKLVVPVFPSGQDPETINVFTYQPNVHYTQEHLALLQAFANQVPVVICNVRQLEEARQLSLATAVLSMQQGREQVFRAIVEQANLLIGADFTGLILQDENSILYRVRPVIPEDYFDQFDPPRQQGGITRAVVESRKPKVISDTDLDPLVKSTVREAGIHSMLAFPLIQADQVLGVLYAHTFEPRYFSQHDVNLWTAFATYAGAALHSTLQQELEIVDYQRLVDELGTLAEKLNLEKTMPRVASAAQVIFRADACRLAYIDPPTSRIISWSWADGVPEQYRVESEPRPNGLTYHVLSTRKPVFRSSAAMAKAPSPVPGLLVQGLRSFASLPLVYGGRVIGILHCNYLTKQQPFNEHLMTLLEAFAAHAAMALNRARRDQISEIWQELDWRVANCTESKTLCQLFTDYALRALRADFAVFYRYDPAAPIGKPVLLEEECVLSGEFQASWRFPEGDLEGGVLQMMEQVQGGLLIVDDLESLESEVTSHLAQQAGVKAFIGLRLEVVPSGQSNLQIAGILLLNYRQVTHFEQHDLVELQHAGNLVAEGILRLNLQASVRVLLDQRNRQLRAVVNIFRAFRERQDRIMDFIAETAKDALEIDVCSLLEYDQGKEAFSGRGAAGLLKPEVPYTPPPEFKTWFMDVHGPTPIPDVRQDKRLRDSSFVTRERILSEVIYPLYADAEPMGLLFASYRSLRMPSPDDMEAIGIFADLAALVMHEIRLREDLDRTQHQLKKHTFLVWVSMIDATWRHSLIQKAASIRNDTAYLQKRLGQVYSLPRAMDGIQETIAEIDRLAADILAAPPRVPQSWEMEAEIFPLAPLLEEIAQRESREFPLRPGRTIDIDIEVSALSGVQVRGYRRWLIYAFEALLQNARNAVALVGSVSIKGSLSGAWAEVRIEDTGAGIPESIRHLLFKERVPKEQDQAGMGIGALLAATIIEDQDGAIELEKSGLGNTAVLIRLPVAKQTGE